MVVGFANRAMRRVMMMSVLVMRMDVMLATGMIVLDGNMMCRAMSFHNLLWRFRTGFLLNCWLLMHLVGEVCPAQSAAWHSLVIEWH